jgi:hypothetical protein
VGLERGPLSLVSTIEELLGRKSSGSGLESRDYGCRGPASWPDGTLYPKKFVTNFADKRSGFDSRRYHVFWEVVGLEQGPLSLVSTIEELLGRKSSGSSLERRDYGPRDPSSWPGGTLYPKHLLLTSLTSDGCSVGMVLPRTQATEFSFNFVFVSPSLVLNSSRMWGSGAN